MLYLRADLLHIGDVLLIQSNGAAGKLIPKFTNGGAYSHAALFAGGTNLFDAKTTGIAYTSLPVFKVERQPNGTMPILCATESLGRVEVFRLPPERRPPYLRQAEGLSMFRQHLQALDGLKYSKLKELGHATAIGRALRVRFAPSWLSRCCSKLDFSS
jgi:hypothetical protein